MSDLKDKIYKLKDNVNKMTKVFDVLKPESESDIHECYWTLVESYINEIDTSPRDSSGYNWLGWFIFENNWGENDLEIKLSGGEWEKVKTIDDIVRVIESDKTNVKEFLVNDNLHLNDVDITIALRSLASQELNDDDEYDLMMIAADYIKYLRSIINSKKP